MAGSQPQAAIARCSALAIDYRLPHLE